MANKSTTANVKHNNSELTVQQHETDSPILPVAIMERLDAFKPEAVDWILNQTQTESEHRRKENEKINSRVFIEHILGQVFALVIGLSGISSGSYVAIQGQPWAGATIASAAITGLAVVFIKGRSEKPTPRQ